MSMLDCENGWLLHYRKLTQIRKDCICADGLHTGIVELTDIIKEIEKSKEYNYKSCFASVEQFSDINNYFGILELVSYNGTTYFPVDFNLELNKKYTAYKVHVFNGSPKNRLCFSLTEKTENIVLGNSEDL